MRPARGPPYVQPVLLARKRKGQSRDEDLPRGLRGGTARGFDAVWWSRFPVGPDDELFELAVLYDRYWDDCIRGRTAVSLCVYMVGGLPSGARDERAQGLSAVHDATLTLEPHRRLSALGRSG